MTASKIFINTGATPRIPDIPGIHTTPGVYTSTGLMDLDDMPQRLVIIGSGFIGLEFASMFADFGTAVTVLQHNAEFLPREDADVAARFAHSWKRRASSSCSTRIPRPSRLLLTAASGCPLR